MAKQVQVFCVRVGEREHSVEIVDEDGERRIHVDGEPIEVAAAGAHVLRVSPGQNGGGRQLEVTLAHDEAGRPREAWITGLRCAVEVRTEAESRLAAALGRSSDAASSGQLKAPMPGRVVKILAVAGEPVEQGAPVVIVEAMKMENELHAPTAGVVERVAVGEGDTVDAGQVLIEFASPESDAG